jgi:hypothetical protein
MKPFAFIQTVIQECNSLKVNALPIRVSWREVDHQRDPAAKIVITNLPIASEEAELHDALTEYGAVDSVRIARSPTGESVGIAYVQFEAVDGALRARESLQGATIMNQPIQVDLFGFPGERTIVVRKLSPGFIAVEPRNGDLSRDPELRAIFSGYEDVCGILRVQAYAFDDFAKAAADAKDVRISVLPGLPWSVQRQFLVEVERRRVSVCDIADREVAGLRVVLSSAGEVVSLEFLDRPNDLSAVAQCAGADARRRALDGLETDVWRAQLAPIWLCPFLDKCSSTRRAGCCASTRQIRSRSRVICGRNSRSSAQSGNCRCTEEGGPSRRFCVLFGNIEVPLLCDIGSSFCDKDRGCWLTVYSLPVVASDAELEREFKRPPIEYVWIPSSERAKVTYLAFPDRERLLVGLRMLTSERRVVDVLSTYLFVKTCQLLTAAPRWLVGFQGRLLFVAGIAFDIGSRGLREKFEAIGPVEPALVMFGEEGIANRKGVVLFHGAEHATVAK